jgi:Transcriptional regulator
LTKNELKIIDLIKKNNTISQSEIAKRMKINESTVYRNIAKLKSLGILTREGSDKTGKWVI